MSHEDLRIEPIEKMEGGRLLIAFDGWMDGGDVSTGTAEWLIEQLDADQIGDIDPEPFYLLNFPGSMEVASLFRPHVRIEHGLVEEFEPPADLVYHAPDQRLVIVIAREPHMHWRRFADAILELVDRAGVEESYFVGSVAGMTPHTREPRLRASVSSGRLIPRLEGVGVGLSDYEGPASFITYLTVRAAEARLQLASLVAEIPAYVQGQNPKAIESVLRKILPLLDLPLDIETLRAVSDQWEKRIDEAVTERDELAQHIHKLEEDYDHEVFDTQMGDLKTWLEQQGIEVD
ncbi:MAG: PAC2 family protein [Phycisphaeraceae bacterium]